MKSQRILAVLLILSLALVPMIPLRAAASSSYTENLTINIAGSSAMWTMRLENINASNSHLSGVESLSGVNWYNVTAIDSSSVSSDFQVFGPQGYNLIPLPFIPQQGLFLAVGASGFAPALSAAQLLDPYFLTSFTSVSNGTGVYYFFSPMSFSQIVPTTLMRFIPVADGGFVNALGFTSVSSPGNFTSLPGAMITLGGQRSSSGFTHYLILSGMTTNAMVTNQPDLLTVLGRTIAELQAANDSTSSVVEVRALDGLVLPGNATGVSNNEALFRGTYSETLSPGEAIRAINVTLFQQPPELLVTRTLDAGILAHDQNVSVTVNFRNLSNSTTISAATLDDDWWVGYGFFKLVGGTSTLEVPTLLPQTSQGLTYELEYTGNSTQQVAIPAATARYTFVTTNPQTGKSYNSTTFLSSSVNDGLMLVGPGVRDPVLSAYLRTSTGFGGPVGSTQGLSVVVTNIGNRTASSVDVNHKPVGSLTAGQSVTIPMPIEATSLVQTNLTEGYSVSYLTPEGHNITLSTNALNVVFSHSSMKLGLGLLTLNSTTAALPGGVTNLTLTFTTSNAGVANITSFSSAGSLPGGLSCGTVFGTGLTCSNGVVSLTYSNLGVKKSDQASMSFNLTQPENFLVQPFAFNYTSSGYAFSDWSNSLPVPTGLAVSKTFSPSQLFGGMRSSVSVGATNSGPYPYYNVTITTPNDPFDTVQAGQPPTTVTNSTLSVGKALSLLYNVTMSTSTGNQTGAAVAATYYFGGSRFSSSEPSSRVLIDTLPTVAIGTTPASPEEGKAFSVSINLTNTSPLTLTNVQFSLPIPNELHFSSVTNAQVAEGKIQIKVAQLSGNSVYTATLTGTSSSGVSIPFSGMKFSFESAGQTVSVPALTTGIAINENVLTRYVLPIVLALIVLLALTAYIRRMARATAPASQQ